MLIETRLLINRLLAEIEKSGIDLAAIRNELCIGTRKRDDFREMASSMAATTGEYSAPIQQRIVDLLLDELRSEALYQDYLFSQEAVTLADMPVVALVFQAYPHIANELYPLLIDGFIASLSGGGEVPFQVMGVHADWLQADNSFHRAIIFHEETSSLLEAEVAGRPIIAAAHIFSLDLRNEAAIHRQIARQLTGVHILNPAAGAALLDDKLFTGNCWKDAVMLTPPFVLMSANEAFVEWERRADAFAREHGKKLLIKPRWGTEGRGVQYLNMDEQYCNELLASAYAATEDYILMPLRGNLCCNIDGETRRIVIRINVCWDGHSAAAESAYLQLAGSAQQICSVAMGGSIVSLAEYQNLFCHADLCSWQATAEDWRNLWQSAENGVSALAGHLGKDIPALVGIDILPEIAADNSLLPILLEANGRPAGMGHCRMIKNHRPGNESGVTQRLFSLGR